MDTHLMATNKLPARKTAPTAHVLGRDIDLSVLSKEKIAELTALAEKKVAARLMQEAEDEFLRLEMARLDKAAHPETVHEMREVRIDCAAFADRIKLDGKDYWHGESYTVPKPVYDVIKDCEARSWRHQDEIEGKATENFYRQSRQVTASMRTGAVTTRGVTMGF